MRRDIDHIPRTGAHPRNPAAEEVVWPPTSGQFRPLQFPVKLAVPELDPPPLKNPDMVETLRRMNPGRRHIGLKLTRSPNFDALQQCLVLPSKVHPGRPRNPRKMGVIWCQAPRRGKRDIIPKCVHQRTPLKKKPQKEDGLTPPKTARSINLLRSARQHLKLLLKV